MFRQHKYETLTSVLGFVLIGILIYFIAYQIGLIQTIPNLNNLLQWDAGFYHSIMKNGYEFNGGAAANSGFQPLFPLLWRLSGLNILGVSILNGIIFLSSSYFLARTFNFTWIQIGLFLSLPFACFFYNGLSEALFFLECSLILYGLKTKKDWIIPIAVLAASTTRPSIHFILIAAIGSSIMSLRYSEILSVKWVWKVIWQFILPTAVGVSITAILQYVETGEAWAYYITQSNAWGREFGFPVFPIGMNSEPIIVIMSWLSFWIGIGISLISFFYLMQWVFKKYHKIPDPITNFSLIYLVMSVLSILLFNPEWFWVHKGGYNATYLVGINRYLFTTPFLPVAAVFFLNRSVSGIDWNRIAFLITITGITILLVHPDFSSSLENKKILQFMLVVCSFSIYLVFPNKWYGFALIIAQFFIQFLMYSYYLNTIQID